MQDMEQIYKKYFEVVNKYLFCLTHNSDISEELTQETFCKAVEKIDTFKGESKMSVWLCQIAKNLWYNQHNKNKRFIEKDENDLLNIQDINITEDSVISNEDARFRRKDKRSNVFENNWRTKFQGNRDYYEKNRKLG